MDDRENLPLYEKLNPFPDESECPLLQKKSCTIFLRTQNEVPVFQFRAA